MIGNVDAAGRKLVDVTKICMDKAIQICEPGRPFNHLGTEITPEHLFVGQIMLKIYIYIYIGAVIETCARSHGFKVVPAFIGHGIGEYFHGAPDIYHFRKILQNFLIYLV